MNELHDHWDEAFALGRAAALKEATEVVSAACFHQEDFCECTMYALSSLQELTSDDSPTPKCPFPMGTHVRLVHSPLYYVGTVAGWTYSAFYGDWIVVLNNGSMILPQMIEAVPEDKM